jgi:putative ABC transport system permease protein
MIKNYLLLTFRNLWKNKSASAINLLGLSLGVTCFALIVLFVQDELRYDRHHQKSDRIYRLTEVIAPAEHSSSQPFSVAPTLAAEYTNLVEHAVRFFNMQAPTIALESDPEHRYNERRFFFVDSTVFNVFDIPLLQGNAETALNDPYSILLTKDMALKYFGKTDVVGQMLRLEGKHPLKVTGVMENVTDNSHLKFDFLASFSTVTGVEGGVKPEGWNWNPCWTYLLLTKGSKPETLAEQLPGFVKKHFPDNIRDRVSLHLQRLTDIHLRSHLDYEIEANSDVAYIYIFSAIAAFVLLVACINYVNLTTARSSKRAHEVGVRKTLGAGIWQLVRQFLGESFLTALLATAIALPLTAFCLPAINTYFDKDIHFNLLNNSPLLIWMAGVSVFIGLVAGLYPAFVLSSFRPPQALKGKVATGWMANLRKGLVVVQFAISTILITGTLVAYAQLRHMRQAKLGFDREQVVMVNIFRSGLAERYDAFKSRLLENSGVLRVTTAENVLGSKCQTNPFKPEGSNEFQQFQRLMVGHDFTETFHLEMAAGRSFDKSHPTDDTSAVLVNETMVRRLGWGTPEEALGKGFAGRRRTQRVVGVLKDFHFASLHTPIAPFVLDIADSKSQHNFFDRYLAVRIAPENARKTLDHLANVWASYYPERPFEYFFADDELDKLYRAEENFGKIAMVFSAFALFVACIGLLGMVAFMAETRTREIGIRKVLGASVAGITGLLAKDFLKLVVIAILIASPIAYYFMQQWLSDFAYRIDLQWWMFAASGAAAVLVAFLTVGFQSVRAALANPVKSLRSE